MARLRDIVIDSLDPPAEVERLCKRGARVRDEHETFTVMLDPEGNEFCLVDSEPSR